MSLEDLRNDLKANLAEARNCQSWEDVKNHLVNTVWPYLEAQNEELAEMDDTLAELVDQQEDYVQPETAAVFAAVIQLGLQLGAELKKRHPGDANVAAAVDQHEAMCQQAVELLGQITMVPNDDDEDEGEDDDEDDEGDQEDGTDNG